MPRKMGILLVVFAALAAATGARASTTQATFAHHGVDVDTGPAEPGMKIDPATGTMYAFDFPGSLQLWTSTDGTSWRRGATSGGGGGDVDVALGPPGVVYGTDLFDRNSNTTIPVSVSTDYGRTFHAPVNVDPSASGVAWDRQWIAARGSRVVVSSLFAGIGSTSVSAGAGDLTTWVSTDGAKHFGKAKVAAHGVDEGGPLAFAPDGTLWTALFESSSIALAKSTDGGGSWTTKTIARETSAGLFAYDAAHFPVVTFDGNGDMYVAFSMCAGSPLFHTSDCHVDVVTSTNKGASWTKPLQLSAAGHTALFPWVATRSGGAASTGADVVFYQETPAVGPDLGPDIGGPQTRWDIVMAQTRDAGRSWTKSKVVGTFHHGSVCTEGTTCAGLQMFGLLGAPTPFDRRDLDFFMVAADRNGTAYVIYPKDRPYISTDPNNILFADVDVDVAKQTGGPRI
jgi:hypothetical protein